MKPANRFGQTHRSFKRLTGLIMVISLTALATGCDSIDATAEAPMTLTGTWNGQMSHPFFPGTIFLTASHVGTQASGTWVWNWASVNSGATGVSEGMFSGSISERGAMELIFTDTATNCTYLYAGTFKNQDEVSGSYVSDAATCRTSVEGTISLARQ